METQLKKRTVCPDGEAIKRLRLEKGWRVEDLATKAICSVKTVENVERGANVYVFTLAKLAKGLGVDFMTLVQGGKPAPEPPKPQRCIHIELVVRVPFDQFDESEQLGGFIEFLKQFMKDGGNINVVGVAPGSTVITVEVSIDDILALSCALSMGLLAKMLCDEIRLKYKPATLLDSGDIDITGATPLPFELGDMPIYGCLPEGIRIVVDDTLSKNKPQRRKSKKHKRKTES
jgi:transcriptional regulator with XRE-family HTH domain